MRQIRRAEAVAQVLVDEPVSTVAAHVPDGRAVVLEGGSEVIWHRLPGPGQEPVELVVLADELAGETGVDAAEMRAQVQNLVRDLAAEGLVELVGTVFEGD